MNLRFRYESEIQEASLKLGDESQIDLWFDGVFGGTGTRGGLGSAVWISNLGSSRDLAGGVVGSDGLRAAGVAVLRGLGFGCCAGLLCCMCPVLVVLVCVCGHVQRPAGHNRSPRAHSCWLCAYGIQAEVVRLCARLLAGCSQPGFTSC